MSKPRTALDAVKKREILAIVSVGCSRRTAARYVGCSHTTIGNTARRDGEFGRQLRRAERQAEIAFMKSIGQAALKPQYWRAAAWALERLNPHDFARRNPQVVTLDQVARLLAQFAELVVAEVPSASRQRVLARLRRFIRNLRTPQPPRPADAS